MSTQPIDALFARLHAWPREADAVRTPGLVLNGPSLAAAAESLAQALLDAGTRVLATLLDNGVAWILADLAALRAGVVHVPLPTFFTPDQRRHALDATAADSLIGPVIPDGFAADEARPLLRGLRFARRNIAPGALPPGTAKVTFTSGTTAAPKGVCLGAEAMLDVARGLADALAPLRIERHLAVLPLAVLLENIAGVYAPLWQGATVVVPPLAEVGLTGSSTFDAERFDRAVDASAAHSVITLPQMLRAWTAWRRSRGARSCRSLRFVAVGGAACGAPLLEAARAAGLPAYEGYGLSEGASVQTLNLPGADRPGSVGRALPHARVRVRKGEIEIAGTTMLGYVGEAGDATSAARSIDRSGWWRTGDIGEIDVDGFIHVRGRSKHVLITSFGRNVSPEWIETTLCAHDAVAQAAVFGDGEPSLSAVIWPLKEEASAAALASAVAEANAALPDYARIGRWVRARVAFSAQAGTATSNGRPIRRTIHQLHAAALGSREGTHALP